MSTDEFSAGDSPQGRVEYLFCQMSTLARVQTSPLLLTTISCLKIDQVRQVIRFYKYATREEFVNHEPQASGLRILRVFHQHPKCFISR